MSINSDQLLIFLPLTILVIVGNLLIHFYYKKKQKIVESNMQNRIFVRFNNVKVIQKWNFGIRIKKADLILIDDQILAFFYNPVFKQAQPIVSFYKGNCDKISKDCVSFIQFQRINITENGFTIIPKSKQKLSETSLKIKFNLNSMEKYELGKFIERNGWYVA